MLAVEFKTGLVPGLYSDKNRVISSSVGNLIVELQVFCECLYEFTCVKSDSMISVV